jgi:hypothetical protein
MGRPEKRARGTFMVVGLLITAALHAGVFGFVWFTRNRVEAAKGPGIGTFVDAQLVKFGRPRDLKFLPHKQGVQKDKGPLEGLKVAKDINQAPNTKDDKKAPDEIDPLKKTRAEMFKNLKDDREGFDDPGVGSPTGSKAGTATEAKGDPYILSLIDQIGTAWTVPTTIKDSELANLSADVCLTIAPSGALTNFRFDRKSGNSQFDSSLEATLGMMKSLPPPPDRWQSVAQRGRLCPTFSKQ